MCNMVQVRPPLVHVTADAKCGGLVLAQVVYFVVEVGAGTGDGALVW